MSNNAKSTSAVPGRSQDRPQSRQFTAMALNMSWQLAIAVLVPVVGGAWLGEAAGSKTTGVFIGLAIAFALSGVVMWRTMQIANSLPVPKLTAAERRKVKQAYDEDDE